METAELTTKQQKLIEALLAGNTIQVSSKIAGCSERSAYIWLKLPHVLSAMKDAQKLVFENSINRLMVVSDDAVSTLHGIMKDADMPASTRVRSAQILLEQCIEMHKTRELEQKIAELEELVKNGR